LYQLIHPNIISWNCCSSIATESEVVTKIIGREGIQEIKQGKGHLGQGAG
jgi:hypothetical protein